MPRYTVSFVFGATVDVTVDAIDRPDADELALELARDVLARLDSGDARVRLALAVDLDGIAGTVRRANPDQPTAGEERMARSVDAFYGDAPPPLPIGTQVTSKPRPE